MSKTFKLKLLLLAQPLALLQERLELPNSFLVDLLRLAKFDAESLQVGSGGALLRHCLRVQKGQCQCSHPGRC